MSYLYHECALYNSKVEFWGLELATSWVVVFLSEVPDSLALFCHHLRSPLGIATCDCVPTVYITTCGVLGLSCIHFLFVQAWFGVDPMDMGLPINLPRRCRWPSAYLGVKWFMFGRNGVVKCVWHCHASVGSFLGYKGDYLHDGT